MKMIKALPYLILLVAAASGCAAPTPTPTITPTSSFTPSFTPSVTWTPSPTATWTPSPTATHTPTPTHTLTPSATPTPPPSATPPPTATPARPTSTPMPAQNTDAPTSPPGQSVAARPPSGVNLLINGGFEGGAYFQDGIQELQVPEAWVAWWEERPASHDPDNQVGYQRPEMKVIRNQPPYQNPPRIHQGSGAAMFFATHKVVDAGYRQQVAVQPGARLYLTGWGHAWSSGADDPFRSQLDSEDARRDASFRVGIDPTGGTNPNAPSVVWGKPSNLYDQYQQIQPVEVTAQGDVITVFVHGWALWPTKHNDFYFDSIHLEYVQP